MLCCYKSLPARQTSTSRKQSLQVQPQPLRAEFKLIGRDMKGKSASKGKSRSKSKDRGVTRTCRVCMGKRGQLETLAIPKALYRKYSGSQNHYYLTLTNSLLQRDGHNSLSINLASLQSLITEKESLRGYQPPAAHPTRLPQTIKLFEYHKDIPRIFVEEVSEIIKKRHHAHRLLEYFRLAKMLGISVEQQSFSTFVHSMHRGNTPCSFDRVIGEISSYNFSLWSEASENPEKLMIRQIHDLLQQYSNGQKQNESSSRQYSTPMKRNKACRRYYCRQSLK